MSNSVATNHTKGQIHHDFTAKFLFTLQQPSGNALYSKPSPMPLVTTCKKLGRHTPLLQSWGGQLPHPHPWLPRPCLFLLYLITSTPTSPFSNDSIISPTSSKFREKFEGSCQDTRILDPESKMTFPHFHGVQKIASKRKLSNKML